MLKGIKCKAISVSTEIQCKNYVAEQFSTEFCRMHSRIKNVKKVITKEPVLCTSKTKYGLDCRMMSCEESENMCFYHFVVNMLEKHFSVRKSNIKQIE